MPEFDMKAPIGDPFDGLEPLEPEVKETKVEPPASTIPPALDQKIQQIQTSVQGNELLTKVLSIPGVQDLLKAHQAGTPFRVVTGNDAPAPAAAEPPPDWEKMKEDPQLLVEHLMKRIGVEMPNAFEKIAEKKIQPLMEKIAGIDQTLSSQTSSQVKNTIEQMKTKYPDFDSLRSKMAELNQQVNGGLDLEDLYKLAKVKSGLPLVEQKELETERPTDNAARHPSAKMKPSYPTGRRGMKQAIADAVAGFDLESAINQ